MIKSMTAFAKEQIQASFATVNFEVRSVNSRFLDLSFRLPELFRELEPKFRDLVKKYLERGKVDVALRFQAHDEMTQTMEINQKL